MTRKTGRTGFTLVEVLVVISIMMVLAGILFLGMRSIGTGTREKQTRVTMESLKSMLDTYRLKAGFPTITGTMNTPGSVLRDQNDRTFATAASSKAVPMTKSVLAKLLAISENQKAMDQLPQTVKFTETVLTPGGTDWIDSTVYKQLDVANYPISGTPYISVSDHTAAGGANNPTVLKAPWFAINVTKPILQDAWENPIIFVPAGLGVAGDATKGVKVGSVYISVSAPDGRPFWASAGPDGDFSKGDDNIYSFEP